MSYNSFTDADQLTLLSQPGVFSYRAYGSSGDYTRAIFADGATYNKGVEITSVVFEDAGNVQDLVSKETVEISLSSGRVLDLDFIGAVSGGLYVTADTAGTIHTGESFSVSSGDWAYNKFILLPGQNATGLKQTMVSVTGSVDGALTVAVDYDQVQLSEIGWGLLIKDSSTVTTLNQNIVVLYTYTPTAIKKMTTGGVKVIAPLEIRFETVTSNSKVVTMDFYKCYPSGNLGHGFSPAEGATPVKMDLTFTAKVDTTRTSPDQLYSVTITE